MSGRRSPALEKPYRQGVELLLNLIEVAPNLRAALGDKPMNKIKQRLHTPRGRVRLRQCSLHAGRCRPSSHRARSLRPRAHH
jgi:hypothetical protein